MLLSFLVNYIYNCIPDNEDATDVYDVRDLLGTTCGQGMTSSLISCVYIHANISKKNKTCAVTRRHVKLVVNMR